MWLRRTLLGLGALVVVLGIAASAVAIAAHTAGGRAFIARRIESTVDGEISGRLRVAEVTDVSWRGLHARDVRFSAPDGQDVLVIDDVEIELRWIAMLAGRFVAPSARVRGGRVVLKDSGHGLELDRAFHDPHPRPGPPDVRGAAPLDLRDIDATGLAIFADVHGAPTMAATGLSSVIHVWVPCPGGATMLAADGIAGRVTIRTPIPMVLTATSGTMRYDSDSRERADVDLQGILDGVHVGWTNHVVQGAHALRIASVLTVPDAWSALRETPLIAQASIAELASSGFDFSLRTE